MTLTASQINDVSQYTVSDTQGAFTTELFNTLAAIALPIVTQDLGGQDVPEEVFDYLHALYVCHLYEGKRGTIEAQQIQPGNWQYVKPGETSFLVRYNATIDIYSHALDSSGNTSKVPPVRSDASMPKFRLDDTGYLT